MPTHQPRVQITLDSETNKILALLASKYNKSTSATAADLLRQALEINEDLYFSEISNQRIKEDSGERISHEQAWS